MANDERERKRIQLGKSKLKGKLAEEWVKNTAPLRGRVAKRTGKGSDFELKRVGPAIRNPLTGKTEPGSILAEVKSGKSRLSKLQKETQAKNKDRYEVLRPPLYR